MVALCVFRGVHLRRLKGDREGLRAEESAEGQGCDRRPTDHPRLMARAGFKTRQSVPTPEPRAHIDTSTQGAPEAEATAEEDTLVRLAQFATASGDISHMLDDATLTRIGTDAIRQWNIDIG